MEETLRRLEELKRRLDQLHVERLEVLAETHRLVGELETQAMLPKLSSAPSKDSRRTRGAKRRTP